jgi:peptidoglycan/LPS O-acetylase OafA/YrhL
VAFSLVSQPFAARFAACAAPQAECTAAAAAAAATAAVAAAQCSMFLVENNLMRLESHPFVTKSFTSIANHV